MGINFSFCCCCNYELKQDKLKEISEDPYPITISKEEIIKKLEHSKDRIIELLNKEIVYFHFQEDFSLALQESHNGHILKLFFEVSKTPAQLRDFFATKHRHEWDRLVETSEILEEHPEYTLMYIKYKSQVSYSSKELLIATASHFFDGKMIVYFTSVPSDKIHYNKIEVHEGAYYIQGNHLSQLTLIVHFKIGANSLTKLLQNMLVKIIPDVISDIQSK
jgi:hypothetical protein